jgi:hypothetical protein
VRAKKLFAYKEQSKTEPVALDVLVMSLARAYLLTILNGIAGRGHSRTVPVSEISFVVGEALLDLSDDFWFRKELVRTAMHIAF